GMPPWQAGGAPGAVTPGLVPGQGGPATVIDVRQASEYADGHPPRARNVELGALTGPAPPPRGRPAGTLCAHRGRAPPPAPVRGRAGQAAVAVLTAGPRDWAEATGRRLDVVA